MVRRTDSHWKYAEKLDNNGFKCKFCKAEYASGVSRIKFHLSSIAGRGIKLCPKVPRDVQQEVTREIENNSRKRKVLSNSFDDEDNNNTEPTSSQNQNYEVGIQAGGDEDGGPMDAYNTEQQVEEGNQIDNNIEEPVQSVETRGKLLRTSKLVGEAFRENLDKIWAWLVNDGVSSIGIYGMAGVGKTELAKHINNKLLKDSNPFHHVYWFDVPRNFTLRELQNAIAKKVGLHFSDEIGENEKAAELSEELGNGRPILILDNVWNDIDLEEVGIPVSENGCKMVLTTRSFDVCRVSDCQKIIKVDCLGRQEDWDLFKEKLGHRTALSGQVEEIVRDVVGECNGLPLALVKMARRMRGVVDIHQWRKALNKLKGPTTMQDNIDVFLKLKLSYDNLDNSAMRQCFLCCSLFPGDVYDTEELIEHLIVEGIIERGRSRQQEIDEGRSMVNILVNVCLLEEIYEFGYMKMHNWIRKMALQIQSPLIMVETDQKLIEFPDENRWTENLLRVVMSGTSIEEIPFNLSPRCPGLSTLCLVDNTYLKLIPDSFFEKLSGLKVINLCCACVEMLPVSLFNLVGLVSLLLRDCKELRRVPSLESLQELERLDMSGSGLEEVPDGMKLLSKLRYLDLTTTKLREFPVGILPNLLCLQFLKLDLSISLLEDELKCLRKLETLQCGLDKYGSDLRLPLLNECSILIGLQELILRHWSGDLFSLQHNIKKLVMENFDVVSLCNVYSMVFTHFCRTIEILHLESMKNLQVVLRRPYADSFVSLKIIKINKCSSIKILFTPLLASYLINLEEIEVAHCSQMEEIVVAAAERGEEVTECNAIANVEIALPKLRILSLRNLRELKSICNGKIVCESIQYITVVDCAKLKRMPLSLVSLYFYEPLSLYEGMQISHSSIDYIQRLYPLPSLREIKVCTRGWWESLEWDDPNAKNVLGPYVRYTYPECL